MSNELANPENRPGGGQTAMAPLAGDVARDDAVNALISAGLSRAGTLVLSPDESSRLMAPFPDEDFQSGAAGKENLIYIEHAALRNRLNQVLGLGQWTLVVRDTRTEKYKAGKPLQDAIRVFVRVTMIIRGSQVGDSIGDMSYFPHNPAQNYGDAWEGAKTAAFRRCAKEFGIGLQAWQKDWCLGWWARRRGGSHAPAPARGRQELVRQTAPAQEPPEDLGPPPQAWGLDPQEPEPEFGPPVDADNEPPAYSQTAGDATENYDAIEIKMVKVEVGKGPRKLFAKSDGLVFDLWPRDAALFNAFCKAWSPPSSKRVYHIECLKEQNGEYVNRKIVLIEPV